LKIMPRRIQLRRTKGWRIPANTVVVSRPSKWGNPYRLSKEAEKHYADNPYEAMADAIYVPVTPEAVVNYYRRFLKTKTGRLICRDARKELRGKNLACWCRPGAPCHADVLLELANK
jgi:hypothetical protein